MSRPTPSPRARDSDRARRKLRAAATMHRRAQRRLEAGELEHALHTIKASIRPMRIAARELSAEGH